MAESVQWHAGLLDCLYGLVDALAGRSKYLCGLVGERFYRLAGRVRIGVDFVQPIQQLAHNQALHHFNRRSG
jgi:hypothetical protein